MQKIKEIIKDNRVFFLLYCIFFFISGIYITFFPREHFLIFLNSLNNPFLDSFFKYMTFLGDGIFILIVLLPISFLRVRFAILTVITYAVSGIITQIIKHIVQSPRPLNYLIDLEILHKVSGIDIYYYNSFPSGHSATGFAFFLLLSLITKNKRISFIFFLFAFFIGLSRIYLLQHFLVDVWAGSFIGIIVTIITFYIFETNEKINNSNLLNFSLYYKLKQI